MVKMILEYAQLLSTAHYVPDSDNCEIRNKKDLRIHTHKSPLREVGERFTQ